MKLKVSRILHAGYIFEAGDTKIAFDPIFETPFSRNCHPFPAVEFDLQTLRSIRFDAVFISHHHDDHCSLESLTLLDRATPLYIYCLFEEMFDLIRALGFSDVRALRLDVKVSIGTMDVTPRRALDDDVDSIFHIKANGLNILNVVDSWIDPETMELLAQTAPWDLVLWPFQTMREIEVLSPSRADVATGELPSEWIEQLRILRPRFIVPSSCQFKFEPWSWYNRAFFPISYERFGRDVEDAVPGTQVVRLNPGVSVELDGDAFSVSERVPWIIPIGEQNLDYDYDPATKPSATREIACHFAALTEEQMAIVFAYCRRGLPAKHKSLGRADNDYWSRPRRWKLSVFDHQGRAADFLFLIEADEMTPVFDTGEPVAWTTEVPLAKLYAALELGESLTSMYLRVQAETDSVDVLEDPLIRCLFNGEFGSYQKAQLKRLQGR